MKLSSSSSLPPLFRNHQRCLLLQIRGGDPSIEVANNATKVEEEKKPELSLEPPGSTVVDEPTPVENTTKANQTLLNVQKEMEEIEESDVDGEMEEEIEVDSDEEGEDYYTDVEDSELDYDEADEYLDDAEENQSIEKVIETAVYVSERAGVLALKVTKLASFWVRQWSWDIYRACERAVDACREELAAGAEDEDDGTIPFFHTKADKDETRLQRVRKKTWRVTKRTWKTLTKMTIAFWAMDDNDILEFPEEDSDLEVETSIKPIFSFLDKLKLRSDYDDEVDDSDDEDDVVDDVIEPQEEAESSSVIPKKPRHSRRKKRKSKRKTTTKTTSIKIIKPEEDEVKAAVIIVPRIRKGRRVMVGVAVGVVCGFCWQQFGASALIMKGVSMLTRKWKPWRTDKANSEEK
ncbi:unnamed protein product [Cylindrotheca closterium]|uniref:Uncharacterized protein n=1 Tax=Cylindrotheca closterium TaxID=2856 RepID=A0AAD2CW98_9STRA|nr:unnamed protein product [Cylindrotheca closterium]